VSALDARQRPALLRELARERFDLVVVGGGITGAGIARDAALRGMSVALLEAEDFAAGTSNRSTKLIHGGLRYLAMGDFALVREAALERKAVHAMAPHLAEPRWMVLPARSRLEFLKYSIGVSLYETLGAVGREDRRASWDAAMLAESEPLLDRTRFRRACVYREYLTDDARLVIATLRAAAGAGACVASRLRVDGMLRERDRVIGARARCGLTGEVVEVRARSVVNAAGPWAERVAALEDEPGDGPRLHLSKGVHIVLPRARLPIENLLYLPMPDGRAVFAIPRGSTVYVGTTDTSWDGDRRLWPEVEAADVDYLLEPVARCFDVPAPGRDDVIATWAGLRPLIARPGKAARELSRRDEIWTGSGGMLTIAGGKLTGFRHMAEDVLAAVERSSGVTLPPPPGPTTLPGGDFEGSPETLARSLPGTDNLAPGCAERLARLYGTEARAVLESGAEPLVPGGELVRGEIDWAVTREAAHDLEDVIYRRTRAAWYSPAEREAVLLPVAARMATLLGWTDLERSSQIEATRARLADEFAFRG
jgi:glycerol-3-phosphate dehydrogenase